MEQISELSISRHSGAVELLKKWRVVPLKHFSALLEDGRKTTASYDFIRQLEKEKIVSSLRLSSLKGKIVIPSKELASYLNLTSNRDQFNHDTVVSFAASAFLELEAFNEKEIEFEHETDKFNHEALVPDFKLKGKSPKTGKPINMAVEVEISRKSFSRIDLKIERYVIDPEYSVVVYLFTGEDLYKIFKKRIQEYPDTRFQKAVGGKIVLVYLKNYTGKAKELLGSKCFFLGKEGVMSDFF